MWSFAEWCNGPDHRGRYAATALLVFALLVGGTLAFASHGVRGVFGSAGSAETEFAGIGGIAVNEASTDVYVSDSGNNRVQLILADGSFWGLWGWGVVDGSETLQLCNGGCLPGLAGGGAGQLSSPQGLAVDPSSQNVVVLDRDNLRVQVFDPVGGFVRTWGWGVLDGSAALQVCDAPGPCQAGLAGSGAGQLGASGASGGVAIDPSSGDVYVADPGNSRLLKFDGAGGFLGAFGAPGSGDGEFGGDSPTRIAVDSSGDVYVVDPGNARVQRFDSTGAFETELAAVMLSGAPAPSEVAVNPSDDHVYVAKGCTPSLCPDDPDVADERRIFEFDSAGSLVDGTHGANGGIGETAGMALNAATGRIYLAAGDRAFILEDIQAPAVSDVVVSSPGATTAWFSASVNANGSPASYRFEYSTNGSDWTPVTPTDQDAGSGSDPVEVKEFVTGLKGDTDYQVRIVATKPFGNPGASSVPTAFSTAALAPEITLGSTTATEDHPDHSRRRVTLRMRIHTQGQPTSYQFQFGPTTSYGSSVPGAPIAIGHGDEWILVEQTITDLDSHATYHYRLSATNPTGTTTGQDQTVQTGPGLPDNRGYEQVSPVEKNGSDIMADSARTRAAGDGDAVQYSSLGVFADAHGTGVATEYIAQRTRTGWGTHSITPTQDPQAIGPYISLSIEPRYMGDLAEDLSKGVLISVTDLDGLPNLTNGRHLFVRDDLLDAGQGSYELISDATSPLVARFYVPKPAGASADFSHVLFSANVSLTADTTPSSQACVLFNINCSPLLYEWVRGSGVRLAGVLPEEEGGGPASRSIAGQGSILTAYTPHTISRDGRRIFFTVPTTNQAFVGALYMREDGQRTVRLNASEKTPPDAPQPAQYWDASSDGSKVFFTSDEQLTETEGSGLYRWDADAPPGARLTLLSVDEEPSDPSATTAIGVFGASEDGSIVYFLGQTQLQPGQPPAGADEFLIYQWDADRATPLYVGRLTVDEGDSLNPNWALRHKTSRVTPQGDLLFISRAETGLVDAVQGTCGSARCAQVYLYRHAADGEAGHLVCASCRPDNQAPGADARVTFREVTGGASTNAYLHRLASDDGGRVFFSTQESLVAEDRNNGRFDVYTYDAANGQLHLISAGSGTSDAYFMDADRSGGDVFFLTRTSLVGWDTDDNVDLYDARVGGGFPEPEPARPPCQGDECRDTTTGVARPRRSPGSVMARRPERARFERHRPVFHVHPLGRRQVQRLAAGRFARLRVGVSERGRVRARARARAGGRLRTVAAASRTASGGGIVVLRLRLSRSALTHLRARGRLRLTIAVSYSPVSGIQRERVTLKRANGRSGR
jgi:hypothetical protein